MAAWKQNVFLDNCQHVEYVTTFWVFGKNAGNFQYSVWRVNTVATENAGMENKKQSKSDAGKPKPTRITEFNV